VRRDGVGGHNIYSRGGGYEQANRARGGVKGDLYTQVVLHLRSHLIIVYYISTTNMYLPTVYLEDLDVIHERGNPV
jgi:hypothetical protein